MVLGIWESYLEIGVKERLPRWGEEGVTCVLWFYPSGNAYAALFFDKIEKHVR